MNEEATIEDPTHKKHKSHTPAIFDEKKYIATYVKKNSEGLNAA